MSRMMKPWLAAVLFGMCCLLMIDGQARSGEKKAAGPLLSKEDSLSTDDGRDTKLENSYRKTYKVKFVEGKTYQLDLKSKDFDAVLRIENSDGKEVAFNDDAPGQMTLDSQIIYKADKGGEYTVIATSLDANGTGKFSLTVVEGPGGKGVPAGKAIALKLDAKGSATDANSLGAGDEQKGGKYFKTYTFPAQAGKTYTIQLKSGDFDAFLVLQDPNGKNLAFNDDDPNGGGTLDSRIDHKATTDGLYRVLATSLQANETGKYTFEITSSGEAVKGGKVPAGKAVEAKLKDGKYSYEGNLGDGDDKVGGKLSKSFKVTLEEGKTYVIDYMSQAFDPYLYLDGPDGAKITEDDDGGEGLNSRITYKAEKTGVYTLRASTFGTGSGAFTLTIRTGDEKEAKNSGLQQRLQGFDKATPEQRKEIASEVIKALSEKGADMSISDARMGMMLAFMVGDDDVKFSRSTIQGLVKAMTGANNPQIAGAVKSLEANLAKLDQIGKSMAVTGTMLDGKEFDLKNLKGKVVLVDFWATWCGPCIAELPNMEKAYSQYHKKGFEIIGISLDRSDDIVSKFIESRKLPWPCINIEDSKKLASLYKVNAIPHPVLIDQEGNIVSLNARGPRLERLLERLVGDRK